MNTEIKNIFEDKGDAWVMHTFDPINQASAYLIAEIEKRELVRDKSAVDECRDIGGKDIAKMCLYNYFALVDYQKRSKLSGLFSDKEWGEILNINPADCWTSINVKHIANMYCSAYGLDEVPNDVNEENKLLRKLSTLSLSESMALVDTCEIIWRGMSNGSFEDQLKRQGIEMSDDQDDNKIS